MTRTIIPPDSAVRDIDLATIGTLKSSLRAAFAAATLGLVACGGSGSGGGSDDLADVSLRLTDAPASLAAAVVVTFTEVHLRHEDGTWSRFDLAAPESIDLMQLQGTSTAELLPQVEVPAGAYTEMRLLTSATAMDNYIELVAGGMRFPLSIPSGSSSGLKIKGDFILADARANKMIADIDLLQSVRMIGPGSYMLDPVIRLVKDGEVGHIRGTVDPVMLTTDCSDSDPSTDNAVYVFEGHDADVDDIDLDPGGGPDEATPVTTANIEQDLVSGDYVYEAAYLPAGDYTIALTCNIDEEMLDEDDDDLEFFDIQNVTVMVNNTLFL